MEPAIEAVVLPASDSRSPLRKLASEILRDREGLLDRIFNGEELTGTTVRLAWLNLALLSGYGAIMGLTGKGAQWFSSGFKLPLLYLFSVLICFPILYVVNLLMHSKLKLLQTLALVLTALGLNALLLAAWAPITLFFIVTQADYHFMKLLHVAILGSSGLCGMIALHRALTAMCEHSSVYPRHALRILAMWIVIFGFVGTQMAWTLRPFLGAPDKEFEFFRHGESGNFYQAIWQSIEGD